MENNETIVLTQRNLHTLSTHPSGNGFTRKQLQAMGIPYPPPRKWLRRLVGRRIPRSAYDAVFHLGDELRAKNLSLANNRIPGDSWLRAESVGLPEFPDLSEVIEGLK